MIEQLHDRVTVLEKARASLDIELTVIRGNVPLAYKQPVDEGVLGNLVVGVRNVKNLGIKVLSCVLIALMGGAGGFYVAFRASLVEQGRTMEREAMKAKYLEQVEQRLRELESRYFVPGVLPMVGPKAQ